MNNQKINIEMVILARESRGWNQTDLAQEIGISQAKVSRYENGMLEIAYEDLEKIADVTGYTVDFFFQTDKVYGLGSSMLFNRKQLSTPIGVQRQVQAKVNILRMQIERLLRGAEIETENKFETLDVESHNGDVAAVARKTRAAWRLPTGPVANVTQAIESAGGIVMLCDFGTPVIDAAHLWLPGLPPMFFMNRAVPGDRHRFNLAHELGHAIMHRFPSGDIEAEANAFAREFLMPAQEVLYQFEGLTLEKAARLKPHWKVSMQAMIYHARCIGCISEWQYRRFFTRLNSLGQRKNEPIPIELEQPTIVPQLVAVHKASFGYTNEELRRLLFDSDPEPQFFRLIEDKPQPVMRLTGGPMKLPGIRKQG